MATKNRTSSFCGATTLAGGISLNSRGQMGYRTPNIDRIGNEGVAFTDFYVSKLHGGPIVLHHRPESDSHRSSKVGMPGRSAPDFRRKTLRLQSTC